MQGLSNIAEIPLPATTDPKEGRRAMRVPLDFSLSSIYSFDLLTQQFMRQISSIVCLYVDNSANVNALVIVVNGSQQNITVLGGTQGYYPVLVPSTFRFDVSSPGSTSKAVLYLLNHAPSSKSWAASTSSGAASHVIVDNFPAVQHVIVDSGITNPLPVQDGPAETSLATIAGATSTLATTVTAARISSTENVTTSGDVIRRLYKADQHLSVLFSLTNVVHTFLTGSPRYFLDNVNIQLDPLMTFAGGGSVVVILSDTVDGVIFQWFMFLPNAATAPTVASNSVLNTPPEWFYKATTNTSSLQLKVNVNPVGSNFAINFSYGFTSL